jgi:hypothetical protein
MRLSNPHITSKRLRHHRTWRQLILANEFSTYPSQSPIKNVSSDTYRTCATITCEVANILSLPPSPPAPLPRCGRGAGGEGGSVDSRRIAPTPLIPPSSPAAWERKGG